MCVFQGSREDFIFMYLFFFLLSFTCNVNPLLDCCPIIFYSILQTFSYFPNHLAS